MEGGVKGRFGESGGGSGRRGGLTVGYEGGPSEYEGWGPIVSLGRLVSVDVQLTSGGAHL